MPRYFLRMLFITSLLSTPVLSENYESIAVPGGPTLLVPQTSIAPENYAVLFNAADPQSVDVALYYAATHPEIPDENFIELNFPFTRGTANMTKVVFDSVKAAMDTAIYNRQLDIQALILTWTWPYSVGIYKQSINTALGIGLIPDGTICDWKTYYDSGELRPFEKFGVRPAMLLAGTSFDNVRKLIDRGLQARATLPGGTGYFLKTSDSARSFRAYDMEYTAANFNPPLNLVYSEYGIDGGTNQILYKQNVLFYFTGIKGVNLTNLATNTFLPGSLADNVTSYGGLLLTDEQQVTSAHMSQLRWLEAGATASYGTITEPYALQDKFPKISVAVKRYLLGASALEAYSQSVRMPCQGVFTGDPLARPYGTRATMNSGTLNITTSILTPGKTYRLMAANAADSTLWTILQSNIIVDRPTFTTISVPQASQLFYKLESRADLTPPATPQVLSPTAGEIVNTSYILKCSAVQETGVEYSFRVRDVATGVYLQQLWHTQTQRSVTLNAGSTYDVQVQARDQSGNISPLSTAVRFSTAATDSGSPTKGRGKSSKKPR